MANKERGPEGFSQEGDNEEKSEDQLEILQKRIDEQQELIERIESEMARLKDEKEKALEEKVKLIKDKEIARSIHVGEKIHAESEEEHVKSVSEDVVKKRIAKGGTVLSSSKTKRRVSKAPQVPDQIREAAAKEKPLENEELFPSEEKLKEMYPDIPGQESGPHDADADITETQVTPKVAEEFVPVEDPKTLGPDDTTREAVKPYDFPSEEELEKLYPTFPEQEEAAPVEAKKLKAEFIEAINSHLANVEDNLLRLIKTVGDNESYQKDLKVIRELMQRVDEPFEKKAARKQFTEMVETLKKTRDHYELGTDVGKQSPMYEDINAVVQIFEGWLKG